MYATKARDRRACDELFDDYELINVSLREVINPKNVLEMTELKRDALYRNIVFTRYFHVVKPIPRDNRVQFFFSERIIARRIDR